MIRDLLRFLFAPHSPTPPMPPAETTSDAERRRIEQRTREITARIDRLRLEAERPALRIYGGIEPPMEGR